jgi:NAD(P)-dependent dehydrogenase (short-subunit alcohol dehydrogenase family)
VTALQGRTVLVTGANRGLGRALVDEALARGASQVYAGTRRPFEHPDPRVTPLALDITDPGQVDAAVAAVPDLDVLVNNAGVGSYEGLDDRASLERHLAVNVLGTYTVTQAFLPRLKASRGAVVTVLSIAALASLPIMPAYSVSKAASLSLAQGWRATLAADHVRVHTVLAGPVDTDMVRGLDLPKSSPASVARGIVDALERDEDDIFPDPASAPLAPGWQASTSKALEREFAQTVAPAPAPAPV